MTTERIDIVVREDGSRVVSRNFNDIAGSADRAQSSLDTVRRTLGSFGGVIAAMGIGAGIRELIQYSDTWANLNGRLSLVTTTTQQFYRVQNDLFNLANKTRTGLEATVDLYARMARATENVNTNDKERLRVTESINKAIKISGASTESANAALVQLGQGLASGTLRGEELNSVLEQTPRLAQAIAEGMGKTVGELRAMGAAGALTSDAVYKALLTASQAIDQEFSKMPVTISQSFTVLNNELMKFVGNATTANGSARTLSEGVLFVAKNLDTLAAIVIGFGAMKFAEFFISAVVAINAKRVALMELIAANAAERASAIASAEAQAAGASAALASATATQAAIASARGDAVAQLQRANANAAAATAAMAAAEAAGAQSYAMLVLRQSTQALAVAEAERSAALAALATLGQQQARVSAQIAAAQAAQTAATTALAGATTAAGTAATLASRAFGLLGGPIGIITTLLGLGVAAWQMWGNKATEQQQVVSQTMADKTEEIVTNLNKQIDKLKERNALAAGGVKSDLVKSESPAAQQMRELTSEMRKVSDGVGQYSGLDKAAKDGIIISLATQFDKLAKAQETATTQQEKLDRQLNGSKLDQWLGKNKQYLSKTEQLAREIADAKRELGDAFNSDIENRIRETFAAKDKSASVAANKNYKASLAALEAQQSLQREIMQGGLQEAESLYSRELMSLQEFTLKKLDLKLQENDMMRKYVEEQLRLATGKDETAQREKYLGELAVLEQKRKNIIAGVNNEIAEQQDAMARASSENDARYIKSINEQITAQQAEYENYGKLPEAITASTIARLQETQAMLQSMGADQAKIDAIKEQIALLGQLGEWQQSNSMQRMFDLDTKKIGSEWRNLGNTISDALTTAFGKGGRALGGAVKALTDYKAAQRDIALQSKERLKVVAGNAQLEADEQQRAFRETEQARAGAYAEALGSAKEYFGEQTAAYKVLSAAEQTYRALQMALAVENMVRQLFMTEAITTAKTTAIGVETAANVASVGPNVAADSAKAGASGVAAFAKTLASLPFPANVAAGAAVVALLVGMGVRMRGSGGGASSASSAEAVQQTQGTGSVFGDSTAKSASISNSIKALEKNSDLSLPLSQGMLSALQSIDAAMSGLTNLVLRVPGLVQGTNMGVQTGTIGKSGGVKDQAVFGTLGAMAGSVLGPLGAIVGSAIGGLVSKVWGKTKQEVTDSGIQFGGNVNSLQSGNGYQQYVNVSTTKSSWFGLKKSTKDSVQTQGLGDELSQQFGLVFTALEDSLKAAAGGLGKSAGDVANTIDGLVLATQKVSLKGLKGDELTAAINAVISKSMDEIAQAVFPGLDAFRQVGEGYAETVMRVASGIEQANVALDGLGITAVKYTDILNKQGDVATEIIRQSVQGVETAGTGIRKIIDTFSGSAQELLSVYQDLISMRSTLNNAGLNGSNLSTATIQGAGGLDKLKDGLGDFLDGFFTEAERNAMSLKDLTAQFAALGIALPQTKQQYVDLVKQYDNGTESGAKMVGKLLSMSGAFSDLQDAMSDVTREVSKQRASLQISLLEAQGRKQEALNVKRRQELAEMDASTRSLQEQVWAYEDLQNAQAQLQSAYDDYADQLIRTYETYKDLAKTLRKTADDMLLGESSTLSPEEKYKEAKSQFDRTYTLALSGDQEALKNLPDISQRFLDVSKEYYASSQQYTTDFDYVRQSLQNAASAADTQASIAEQQLNATNEMVKGIVDLKTVVGTSAQSLASAFASAFAGYQSAAAAVAQATAPSQNTNGSFVESLYGNILGRHSEKAGYDFWVDKLNNGASQADIIAGFYGSDEYKRLHPSRAVGGYTPTGMTWVGERGPELVNFERPGMVYTAEESRNMSSGNTTDLSALLEELRELKEAIVRELQAANTQRGMAAVASIEKLQALMEKADETTRSIDRMSQ